jgi:hypothetical protein
VPGRLSIRRKTDEKPTKDCAKASRFRDSAIDSPATPMLQYDHNAGVAQLVEQLFCKQQVVSSSLSTGSSTREG